MDNVWNLNQSILMGVALGLFGFLGFRRGVNRELLQSIGLALAMWLSNKAAPVFRKQVNLFYKLTRFALSGGMGTDNPGAAWQEIGGAPPLIQTEEHLQYLALAMFIVIASYFYLLGHRRFPNPNSIPLKVLGAFTGLINGFLMSYYLFPVILPDTSVSIRLPTSDQAQQTLTGGQTVARVVAFFFFILIALGLYSASGPRRRE